MDYNWKRFFCPREKRISLSDDGFFYDPDSALGSRARNRVGLDIKRARWYLDSIRCKSIFHITSVKLEKAPPKKV